ncbi:class I SAM-dependent methyltransferase [Prosthecodimorpha staleyi]|uniref:Methyltransferase domain-containing protein n=1 Tax=Prosthecodimorpha staleyi TaxID=2840188 RepID=A0A947DCQ1_9HYPH|nr:class I SAM-dependent methyltransferase [Prosthecodimorpha staleyi]MBT9292499.1 methyltransferase domain-containing protein [Prosthecodimorpha staleyi]
MLFNQVSKPQGDAVFIHVHVPRTGGTSLRRLFERTFGAESFIFNYNGEIETATPEQRDKCRLISGHIPYGVHRYFSKPCHYITATRDPIARYQSLYAEFLTNSNSRLHHAAVRYGIDDFLRFCIYSDDAYTLHQLGNLQCRLISGSNDFETAKAFIDSKYLLACPLPELDLMVAMLAEVAGAGDVGAVERVNWSAPRLEGLPSRLVLSDASLDLLFEHDSGDFHLHSYVQQAFRKVAETWVPGGAPGGAPDAAPDAAPTRAVAAPVPPRPDPEEQTIPPSDLRFMGEADADFMGMAQALADQVRTMLPREIGDDFELLDVGCGYGRLAYGLRARDYPGRYTGFDCLPRQIDWLNRNFGNRDAYRFHHLDLVNERYNPTGRPLADVSLPMAEQSSDCLVALSVFTHMYEHEVVQYFRRLKALIRDGGLFIATFFRIPPGFALGAKYPNAIYELTKRVSENAFIASEDQPLWVIAFREAFLLKLFAREGFEVVLQRKGKWLSGENALGLQDWFMLRKKPSPGSDTVRFAPIATNADPGVCPICGSKAFGPGPGGRLAASGSNPRCLQCDSLERHRIVRTLFHGLPIGLLNWRHALLIGASAGIEPGWFRSMDRLDLERPEDLAERLAALPDGSCDFVVLDHVLEFVDDDRAAFAALRRVLSGRGILLITFANSAQSDRTVDFAEPTGPYARWHAYGADLPRHFDLKGHRMRILAVSVEDPGTGVRETAHLFFSDQAAFHQVRRVLGVSNATGADGSE